MEKNLFYKKFYVFQCADNKNCYLLKLECVVNGLSSSFMVDITESEYYSIKKLLEKFNLDIKDLKEN